MPTSPPAELVALRLGDDEVSISLVVLGAWDPHGKGLHVDLLSAEWRGESEMGRLRAPVVLTPDVLDDMEAAAADLLAGRVPRWTYDHGGGQRLWESNDRDSRLGLVFAADGRTCTSVQMSGVHGWPTFAMPLEEPLAEVGRVLAAGAAAVRAAFLRLRQQ